MRFRKRLGSDSVQDLVERTRGIPGLPHDPWPDSERRISGAAEPVDDFGNARGVDPGSVRMNLDTENLIERVLAAGSRALDSTKNFIVAVEQAATREVKIHHARAGQVSKTAVEFGPRAKEIACLRTADRTASASSTGNTNQHWFAVAMRQEAKIAELESALQVMTEAPGAPGDHLSSENDLHAWLDDFGAPDLSTVRERVEAWALTQSKTADDMIAATRRERDSALDQNRALHDQVVEYKTKAERDMAAMKEQVMTELAQRFETIHDEQVTEIEGLGKALAAHQHTSKVGGEWVDRLMKRVSGLSGLLLATDPVLALLDRAAKVFDGFDLQYRRHGYGQAGVGAYRFRLVTNDNALDEWRAMYYGPTAAEAMEVFEYDLTEVEMTKRLAAQATKS